MRSIVPVLVMLSALGAVTADAVQGNELVVMPGMKAAHLAGVVQDRDGDPLPNVTVTSFACGNKEFRGHSVYSSLSATKSDEHGRFSLGWHGSRTCVEFRMPGMNLLQMEVLKANGAGDLTANLVPGA